MNQLLTDGKSRPVVRPALTLCLALAALAVSGLLGPALAQEAHQSMSGGRHLHEGCEADTPGQL